MSLTTRSIPALMNGISRQPPILRSPDQTEDEVNTWGTVATGVSRRPPTTTLAKLDGLELGDATVHHINRDINERYTVIIDTNTIKVFDETTGEEKTVTAPLGFGYLDAAGPNYRAVTIADYTFIVNTEKTVAMKGVGADETADDANLVLPGGTDPDDIPYGGFLGALYAGARAQYNANPDSSGGLTSTVKSMDDLPDPVCNGCIYKVLGAAETSFVSFYVRGDGTVWNETVQPGLVNAIDETTMPHALIRQEDGTFEFVPFSWQPRRVGDLATNPLPIFVGRTIRDVFFYQNRLGFVADESVIFSAAGDYGQFFRRTVLDYIDSDTLAASATTKDVAILDYAVAFADGVMLFSRQRQLSLTNGESGLSARSLAIRPVTSYIMAPDVEPAPLGSQVHFVTEAGGSYSSVQEYTRLAGADPTEAADISAHVPGLIPKGATQIIPAVDIDALFVIARNAPSNTSRMYAYQFFWNGDEKLQSAWRVWDFGDGTPISGSYQSGSLLLLMERPDGFFLERIDLNDEAVSEHQEHLIYLDRGEAVTGTYDAGTDRTTFALSFTPDADKLSIVTGSAFAAPEDEIDPGTYVVAGSNVSVPGDYSDGPVTIGHRYDSRMVISEQFPTDWQGNKLNTGRLQLHTFTVNLTDTAYTRAEVYPYGKEILSLDPDMKSASVFSEDIFTAQSVGSVEAIIGDRSYLTGPFTFSVAGHSKQARIELVNDSPFRSTWTSAEWEGLFFSRAL